MTPRGATIIVTGAASGIGAALARRCVAEGAERVVLADIDEAGVEQLALDLGPRASARRVDVSDPAQCRDLVSWCTAEHGQIDILFSNAGIATGAGIDASDSTWQQAWNVNVMATVHLATAYLEVVRSVGTGRLVVTASAAGLLTNLGDAPYSATKHALVALAEWLSVTHRDDGLTVQCLCPQGVRTPMVLDGLRDGLLAARVVGAQRLIEPDECAAAVVAALATQKFLILPHPEVADYERARTADRDRWLAGMAALQRHLLGW